MSERVRTVTWQDPAIFRSRPDLSGLEWLRVIISGELPTPPFAALFGMEIVEADHGRVVFEMKVGEYHYSPLNIVHGGVTATLLDTVMGCAVQSTLEAGGGYASSDLQVRYLRPVTLESGTLRGEGKVVYKGSRLATAEGSVTDARGKLIATGSTGCVILGKA